LYKDERYTLSGCKSIAYLLSNLSHLNHLHLNKIDIKTDLTDNIGELKELTVLAFTDSIIIDNRSFIKVLLSLPKLLGLVFKYMSISQDVLEAISTSKQLEEVIVSHEFVQSTLCLAQRFRYDGNYRLEGKSIEDLENYFENNQENHFFRMKQYSN
jgi:hypothetical protein